MRVDTKKLHTKNAVFCQRIKILLTTKQMYSILNSGYQDNRLSVTGYQKIRISGFHLIFWYPDALHTDFLMS